MFGKWTVCACRPKQTLLSKYIGRVEGRNLFFIISDEEADLLVNIRITIILSLLRKEDAYLSLTAKFTVQRVYVRPEQRKRTLRQLGS